MKVYIASSIRRNKDGVLWWTRFLQQAGHTVLSFHELGPRSVREGLDFPEKDPLNRPAFAKEAEVIETSARDKDAILCTDAFLYLEPAGISANRELGFAHHAGKLIIAYRDTWPDGEHDVMDAMVNVFCDRPDQVLAALLEAKTKMIPVAGGT